MIEASERLNEHVNAFIAVFITTGGEEVECFLRVEIVVSVEVAANEVGNALFIRLVQVLELMSGAEFLHIQPVGKDTIRFPLQKMLALVSSNMADSGEDVSTMGRTAFYAITVIDAALAGFGIDIEVLQVIVKVNRASTEVATEESRMGGEDGRDVDLPFLA